MDGGFIRLSIEVIILLGIDRGRPPGTVISVYVELDASGGMDGVNRAALVIQADIVQG